MKKKRKVGRPTKYSAALADRICEAVGNSPHGLDIVCRDNSALPNPQTIYAWDNKYPEFSKSFARARERRGQILFDECLTIADDSTADTLITEKPDGESVESCNKEWVMRSKLRVETRMKMAAKLAPRSLGDRMVLAGDPEAPLGVIGLPPAVPAGDPLPNYRDKK